MASQSASGKQLGDQNAASYRLDEGAKEGDDDTPMEGGKGGSVFRTCDLGLPDVTGDSRVALDNDNGQVLASPESNLTEISPVSNVTETSIFLQDDPRDMTYSRRIALFLMRFKLYYNPETVQRLDRAKREAIKDFKQELEEPVEEDEASDKNPSPPSLEKAWAYFEHTTLPRYLVQCKSNEEEHEDNPKIRQVVREYIDPRVGRQLDRAEPGERNRPTKLYSVFSTAVNQMGDFGLGVGLYYSTLRAFFYLMLIVGLVNIPNLKYYSSTEYSTYGQKSPEIAPMTRGSALCTDQPFVPCTDCSFTQYNDAEERLATSTTPVPTNETFTIFAKRNDCEGAQGAQVMVNYASLFILVVGIWIIDLYHKKMEAVLDEDEQTAQDYSIEVSNPPRDAFSPEEWKDFFSKFTGGAHVTTCTVAVNNNKLLRLLTERRELLRQIEFKLPLGHRLDLNSLKTLVAKLEEQRSWLWWFGRKETIPTLYRRIVALNEQIRKEAAGDFVVNRVFITFEREEDQRYTIRQLWRNKQSPPGADNMFRGTYAIKVNEAGEPSEIRWQYLDQSLKTRLIEIAISIVALFGTVVVLAYVVRILRRIPPAFTAFVIAVFNILFPKIAQAMSNYETHPTEGQRQRSLFIKIAIFRMLNTAIVIRFAMPFTSVITPGDDHLIPLVYAIFWAEIVTSNVIQCLDIGGFVQKCCKARNAASQEQMNLHFRGTTYDLAERYTNMTKILFLVFVYSAIFPSGFFLGAIFFAVTYYVDKFSLMRTWRQGPVVGKETADFSRKYALPFIILCFAMFSSYAWTGFPYDNLCDSGTTVTHTASYTVHPKGDNSSSAVTVDIKEGDKVYKHCNQLLLLPENGVVRFPALPSFQPAGSSWMTDEQEWATNIYGWTSVALLVVVIVIIAWRVLKDLVLWKRSYEATGRVMGVNYSEVSSIDAYIPEVRSDAFSYPLLACKVDGIDEALVGWTDPDKPYEYYDLTRDLDHICEGNNISPHAFGQVKHWPPPPEFRSSSMVSKSRPREPGEGFLE